jgi:hypothetical protein
MQLIFLGGSGRMRLKRITRETLEKGSKRKGCSYTPINEGVNERQSKPGLTRSQDRIGVRRGRSLDSAPFQDRIVPAPAEASLPLHEAQVS